ncbi:MAG: hypothetical protein K6E95_01260 [Lachnospiraceae bacterium]|nr:hypothetical protein [Lachnospiraceae bacterium]
MDWGLWIMFAILVVMVVSVVIVSNRRESKAAQNGIFDERQVKIRGDAFKWSFIVMVVYYLAYAILVSFTNDGLGAPELMIFIGLELGLVFCSVYCILRDAFIAVNRSFGFIVIMDICCIVAQLIGYYRERIQGALLIKDGKLTSTCLPLSIALSFGIILVALFVRRHYQKREEQNEA